MRRMLVIFTVVAFFSVWNVAQSNPDHIPLPVEAGLLSLDKLPAEKEESVEQLALRRVFDCFKIPYDLISIEEDISLYDVIYVAGPLDNSRLDPYSTNLLYDYVENGGTLVAAGNIGSRLYPLFGVQKIEPSKKRFRLTFSGEDPSLRYIDRPEERTISLGNGEDSFYREIIWSFGLVAGEEACVLARFDDGIPGFLSRGYGRGRAYLLGLSYTESVLLPQVGKDYEAQRRYVNSFEPSSDTVMLLVKAIYESNARPPVYISGIPYAKPTALILSHDVDAQTSFQDSLKFADLEAKFGVTSTFFENTKYFTDWMDIDYYNVPENVNAIRDLKLRGWDIGSHTVSHYKKLSSAPEGDPSVTYKTYRPETQISVQGEVRVSKELLDRDVPHQNTVSFRAGDLEFPNFLIRVLEDAGYLYDSTFSANDVLTAFPFRALRERNLGSSESEIFEIPITLDDSMGFLTPDTVEKTIATWIDIVEAHAENEAITVLLVHPSDTREKTYKLVAQELLMQRLVEMGGWMGNLTEFGEFWRSRDALSFSVFLKKDGTLVIETDRPGSQIHPMVAFVVSKDRRVKRVSVQDSTGATLRYSVEERREKFYLYREAPSR
jgi:peptidoglycan/xylan/chitin deacetylase (PgdA/CDA1 family)